MGRQLPGEHPLFQLIAHHDMQAVGQLVGLGADQGGLGLVDHAVERVLADVVQPGGEVLPQPGIDDAAEGPAAADDVFIEPGLAFVNGHGHAASQAGPGQLPAHMQLVQGVAALVDHGIQGRGHQVLLIVGGDAHIVPGEIDGEGVLRLADDAVVSVNVHHVHDEVGKLPLDGHREAPVQGGVVHPVRMGLHLVDEGHQLLPQGGEEGVAGFPGQAPLKPVQLGVIGVLVRLHVFRQAAAAVEHLLQIRLKQCEVAALRGLVPHGVGLGGQLLIGNKFLLRHPVGHFIVPPQLRYLPGGDRVQPVPGLHQCPEHLHRLRGSGQGIAQPGQLAQGIGPQVRRPLRGHGGPIVVHQAGGVVVGEHQLFVRGELLQRLGNGHMSFLL